MVAGKQASTVKAALEKAPQEECEFSLLLVKKEQLVPCLPRRKELQETLARRVLTQATQEAPARNL